MAARKHEARASVAVDGIDLTVAAIAAGALRFAVMPETYRRTTLRTFGKGRRVNIERSVRAVDRLSGHIVRGVVEGLGRVEQLRPDGDATVITYSAPDQILANLIESGPLCVDGVSLAVIAKSDRTFVVSIVAYTGTHTTLLEKGAGDPVNLESDIVMRYVAQAATNHSLWKPARLGATVTIAGGIQQSSESDGRRSGHHVLTAAMHLDRTRLRRDTTAGPPRSSGRTRRLVMSSERKQGESTMSDAAGIATAVVGRESATRVASRSLLARVALSRGRRALP